MLIDRGFFVENFVGTYEMKYLPELDTTLIISKEVNHAAKSNGEKPLLKKRIFEFDTRDDDYIFLNLANVDIASDDSILTYCNKYGLPYSSQLCYEKETGLGLDIESSWATAISKRDGSEYARHDTMDRLEFCRLAVLVRSLMEVKMILERKTKGVRFYQKLIPLIIYLALYSREFIYDYKRCTIYDEHGDRAVYPKTRTMRLQYDFQFFRRANSQIVEYLTPGDQIAAFLLRWQRLIDDPNTVSDSQQLSDLISEENLMLFKIFWHIFCEGTSQTSNIGVFTASGDCKLVPHSNNQFSVDDYNRIKFSTKEIAYGRDLSELIQAGYILIRDTINDGLVHVTPKLVLENGLQGENVLRGEWQLDHQMEGIYMELFSQLAVDAQYRLCANPTCGKFFSVTRSRTNKKYCCQECAALQAKRSQRARKKAELNRTMENVDSQGGFL